jgi:hypothetical protein
MTNGKKIFFTAVLCLRFFAFAQSSFSGAAISLIDSFFDLRMKLSLTDESTDEGTQKILSQIENFSAENSAQISALTEQEKIVLENFIVMENYNYLYEKDGQAKVQHEILKSQLEKIESFAEKNPAENLNEYFLCTWGDVTSCYMGYSVADVLKYGTSVRPHYEKALEKNSGFSYALTNIGQWYYFAPKMTGGSKKKSLEYFEKAYAASVSPSQKYFACIFLSQLLFENKEFDRCKKLLDEAESFCPGSFYLKKIRSANDQGLSLYEYNRKKSSLEKESKSKK